jgi:hypothetical protein
VSDGKAELVVSIRRVFQSTMREELIGAIESLTAAKCSPS